MLPISIIEYVVNSILIIGITLTVLSFVFLSPILRLLPAISGYYRVIQIISIIILCAGIYAKGGYSTEKIWRDKVSEMEEKLKVAEAKSEKVNETLKEKIVYRNQIIREKGDNIIKYVDREVIKTEEVVRFLEVCPIPVDIIKIHNEATRINITIEEATKKNK
jgi:hypothetical protein